MSLIQVVLSDILPLGCPHNGNKVFSHRKGTASSTKATSFTIMIIVTRVINARAIETTQGGKIAHSVMMIEAIKDIQLPHAPKEGV